MTDTPLDKQKVLAELAKARAIFQQRAILAAMGMRSDDVTNTERKVDAI